MPVVPAQVAIPPPARPRLQFQRHGFTVRRLVPRTHLFQQRRKRSFQAGAHVNLLRYRQCQIFNRKFPLRRCCAHKSSSRFSSCISIHSLTSASLPPVLSPATTGASTSSQTCSSTHAVAVSIQHSRCTTCAAHLCAHPPIPPPAAPANVSTPKAAPSPGSIRSLPRSVPAPPDNSGFPAAAAPPPH